MSKESYLIPRRSFLRGVGAALALPSLEIMSPALSYGKTAPAKKALRTAVLFKGAGVNHSSWDITGATETEFTLSKILSPLEKNKKDIVILRNIDTDQRASPHLRVRRRDLALDVGGRRARGGYRGLQALVSMRPKNN